MKKYSILILLFIFSLDLYAKVFISPEKAIRENFSTATEITKKVLTLSSKKVKQIQKEAKATLKKNHFTIYIAKDIKEKIVGYGILINKKVRSKNAVILYLIKNNTLQSIEIIAFNEPQEYLPSKSWQEQFREKRTDKMLHLGKEIPTITGATLSAKSVTDGSRIAFALYNEIIEGK